MAEERKRGKLQWPFVCEGRREQRERERERPSIYETEWREYLQLDETERWRRRYQKTIYRPYSSEEAKMFCVTWPTEAERTEEMAIVKKENYQIATAVMLPLHQFKSWTCQECQAGATVETFAHVKKYVLHYYCSIH